MVINRLCCSEGNIWAMLMITNMWQWVGKPTRQLSTMEIWEDLQPPILLGNWTSSPLPAPNHNYFGRNGGAVTRSWKIWSPACYKLCLSLGEQCWGCSSQQRGNTDITHWFWQRGRNSLLLVCWADCPALCSLVGSMLPWGELFQ